MATPLIYIGNGIQLGLDYRRQSIKSLLDISIDYTFLNEKAKYHQDRTLYITPLEFIPEIAILGDTILEARVLPAKLPHIGLQIAYYQKVKPNRIKRIATYVGASFASDMRLPTSDNVIVFTAIWLNEFSIAVKGSYAFNSKLKILCGAELPVFSLAVRLPYSISPVEPNEGVYKSAFSNIKAVTWNKYQSIRALFELEYLLSRRITLQLNYSSYYLRYSDPGRIHFLQTNSTAGIYYAF